MMIIHRYITLIIISMLPLCSHAEEADSTGRFEFGMQYDTELQTNFHGDCNFLNLLRLDGSVRLSENMRFNISTLSIAHANGNIASDLQTFSNLVTDESIPLTIAVAGIEWTLGSASKSRSTSESASKFFIGVRNTGEDYFASDVTAFYVNSSNGIFPTISANYPIATYPYASMSLHYEYDSKYWGTKATIYNGEGHYRLAGKDNVFRICPKSDGVFVMAQGELKLRGKGEEVKGNRAEHGGVVPSPHQSSTSSIFFGGSLYKDSPTLWTYAEYNIGEWSTSKSRSKSPSSLKSPSKSSLSLIAAYSHCFEKEALCRNFVGVGAKLDSPLRLSHSGESIEFGLFSDYADYSFGHEYATELSCRIPLCKHLSVKPSLHYINGTTEKGLFGLVRMTMVF